jgi:glutathione peroxidase-family protein
MKSFALLFGLLTVACASSFYELPAYNDNGQSESLSRFSGNVTLVVNTAHL